MCLWEAGGRRSLLWRPRYGPPTAEWTGLGAGGGALFHVILGHASFPIFLRGRFGALRLSGNQSGQRSQSAAPP